MVGSMVGSLVAQQRAIGSVAGSQQLTLSVVLLWVRLFVLLPQIISTSDLNSQQLYSCLGMRRLVVCSKRECDRMFPGSWYNIGFYLDFQDLLAQHAGPCVSSFVCEAFTHFGHRCFPRLPTSGLDS